MYTRSYYEVGTNGVPKDYDGEAFRAEDEKILVTPTYGETKISPEYTDDSEEVSEPICEEEKSEGVFSRLFSKNILKKLPFGIGESLFGLRGGLSLEDIIIVAVGLLLLFSKEGDTLLGLALLCLLFIR